MNRLLASIGSGCLPANDMHWFEGNHEDNRLVLIDKNPTPNIPWVPAATACVMCRTATSYGWGTFLAMRGTWAGVRTRGGTGTGDRLKRPIRHAGTKDRFSIEPAQNCETFSGYDPFDRAYVSVRLGHLHFRR